MPSSIQESDMSEEALKTGQLAEVWRRLKRNRAATIGGVIVLLFVAIAILAPLIAPYNPDEGDLTKRLNPPSREHLLGTDFLGRDLLSRVIYGARVSMVVGLVPTAIIVIVGTLVGMIAGTLIVHLSRGRSASAD